MYASGITKAVFLFIFSAFINNASHAQDPVNWYAAATGCTPYHDAINQNMYSNANGRVRFKPGKAGTIWLACNLNGPLKQPNDVKSRYLSITYQIRSDDRVTNVEASATLKAISKAAGQIYNLGTVGVNIGNQPTWLGSAILTDSSQLPRGTTFDFTKNYYYVIITIRRNSTQLEPTVFGVGLTITPIRINQDIE